MRHGHFKQSLVAVVDGEIEDNVGQRIVSLDILAVAVDVGAILLEALSPAG